MSRRCTNWKRLAASTDQERLTRGSSSANGWLQGHKCCVTFGTQRGSRVVRSRRRQRPPNQASNRLRQIPSSQCIMLHSLRRQQTNLLLARGRQRRIISGGWSHCSLESCTYQTFPQQAIDSKYVISNFFVCHTYGQTHPACQPLAQPHPIVRPEIVKEQIPTPWGGETARGRADGCRDASTL